MSGVMPPGPLSYTGQLAVTYINRTFDPTSSNLEFTVPTVWTNTNAGTAFLLTNKANAFATWLPLSGGAGVKSYNAATYTVSPTPGEGDFTTIGAAITASVSGDDILVKAGSYVEDLTMKQGVNLVAWTANAQTPLVTIIGTVTASYAGVASISGINFEGNPGDDCIFVTGSTSTSLNLDSCFILPGTGGNGIHVDSSGNCTVALTNCQGDLGDGLTWFSLNGPSTLTSLSNCSVSSSLGSGSQSQVTTGTLVLYNCSMGISIQSQGGAKMFAYHCTFDTENDGAVCIDSNSGISTGDEFFHCFFRASNQALNINTQTVMMNCSISCGGTYAINGGGVLYFTPFAFEETTQVDPALNLALLGFGPSGAPADYVWTSTGPNTSPQWAVNDSGFSAATWIVDPTPGEGNFTTITDAINAATAGDDILVRTGTYTENLTLKAGVNLVAWDANAQTPLVTVLGTTTYSATGTVSLSGIRLSSNGGSVITISGTNACIMNLVDCYILCGGATGLNISNTNTATSLHLKNCNGDQTSDVFTLFGINSVTLTFEGCNISNSVDSQQTSVVVNGGSLNIINSSLSVTIRIQDNSTLNVNNSIMDNSGINGNCFFLTGTSQSFIYNSYLDSGTISNGIAQIDSGASLTIANCITNSSGTNVFSNSGTVNYAQLTHIGTSSYDSNLTLVLLDTDPSNAPSDYVWTSTGPDTSPTWQPGGTSAVNYISISNADSPYTVQPTDQYISVDTSSGSVSIVFPDVPDPLRTWTIKDRTGNAATGNISLVTQSGATPFDEINFAYVMNSNYQVTTLIAGPNSDNYEINSSYRDYADGKPWLVGPTSWADFQTITAAINAIVASGQVNQTIFVMPGQYVENFILPPNTNLFAYEGQAVTTYTGSGQTAPNVIIFGQVQVDLPGVNTVYGIHFNTNDTPCVNVTGSYVSNLTMINCSFNAVNNTAINYDCGVDSSSLNLINCYGDIQDSDFNFFSMSSPGNMMWKGCHFTNSSNSSFYSFKSGGGFVVYDSEIFFPIQDSSVGGFISMYRTTLSMQGQVTLNIPDDSAVTGEIEHCSFSSAGNSCINIGAGSSLRVVHNDLDTSNGYCISGSGSLTGLLNTSQGGSPDPGLSVTTLNSYP